MSRDRSRRGRIAAVLTAAGAAAAVVAGITLTAGPAHASGAVPTVTGLSVKVGTTAGGTAVLITGTGFTGVDQTTGVQFGGTAASAITVLGDNQISVRSPAGTGAVNTGLVDITITNSVGTSIPSSNSKFAYRQPLTATLAGAALLNPVSGSTIRVDIDFTLSGAAGFVSENITATVGGAAATVTYDDPTHVDLAVPAGTPSAAATTVALSHDGITGTPDTTHATYAAVITGISRTAGPKAGNGETVTVTGKGFTGATGWKWGAADAGCTVTDDATATCVPPASDLTTPFQGAVSVSFTPAAGTPFGYTTGGAYTYTDLS